MDEGLNQTAVLRLITSYNPTEYWIEQGRTYKDTFNYNKVFRLQEQMLSEYLKHLSPRFRSVLEVGCGFGRVTKLILSEHPDVQKYTAVDLSPDQIHNAEKYVRSGFGNRQGKDVELTFAVSDIKSLELDEKFDLVISAEVLLHILPSAIRDVMGKLVDLSNRHIINIDYYQDKIIRLAPHNFLHQYEKIYHEIPSIIEVKRIAIKKKGLFGLDTKQSIFHATREKFITGP